MHHFSYIDGRLHAEAVPLEAIAAQVGTPCYVYSTATLTRHYRAFADAFADLDATICYAMKANGNRAVLRLLTGLGAGVDVVSGGEMGLALAAGAPADRIVFSGVGKTKDEMAAALNAGVHQINVESEPELDALDAVARELGVRAPVAIRVNPDVDAATHAKITTGKAENKFGIEWTSARTVFRRAMTLEGIAVHGVAVHIGSQILDLAPFEAAFRKVRDLVALLRADGVTIDRLDLGGGLGVPYHADDHTPPPPSAYAAVVARTVGDLGCALTIEPGRAIAGNAGVLVSRVTYLKEGMTRTFAIVDAAMNDLMRPALYDAWHDIWPVVEPSAGVERHPIDVVGPVCESSDTFARDRSLPPLAADDLVAFMTAGAYGAVMSGQYNGRPLVPEVLVDGDRFHVVRRRPTLTEMASLEDLPPWLTDAR
ncbi:diaminopimelate decarboxylase [Roseospira marina]|uniref:Diaminopimelate decarboxylase n=1 Tax=Roseospira marina TaxID=140057 RepID=A0A5M6IGZ8_9PROT|nr:diaminopimelate decarboxylase [Roseospira marina]KAA5607504.1 diaminopimelate decarboxylase [Roseospira marina]MBB4312312.1 diaminopimelate decarboxylase [Roseospira marina]MBB5085672.1 diaminopimelate decarboxylase [Roseospira marina]